MHPRDVGNPPPWLGIAETEKGEISNVSNVSNTSSQTGEQPQEDSFLVNLTSTSAASLSLSLTLFSVALSCIYWLCIDEKGERGYRV